jgi:hypothetical protein
MFQKCAAPPVGEIKDRHVEYEHGVVPADRPTENSPQALAKAFFFVLHDLLRQHDYRFAEMKPRSACGIFQYPF